MTNSLERGHLVAVVDVACGNEIKIDSDLNSFLFCFFNPGDRYGPVQRSYTAGRWGCDPDASWDDPTGSPEGPAQSPTPNKTAGITVQLRFPWNQNENELNIMRTDRFPSWMLETEVEKVCELPFSWAVWGRCRTDGWGSDGSASAWRSPLWWNHPDRLSPAHLPSDTSLPPTAGKRSYISNCSCK